MSYLESILEDQNIRMWPKENWPDGLTQIPSPPKQLFIRGEINSTQKFLTIVGPRKYTEYGENICRKIIEYIACPEICLVSGLAYGIDSLVHEMAIENKMRTIALPGSGLGQNVIYPRGNLGLAQKILENRGALISEFPINLSAKQWTFPQRNRLMAGFSEATLIIEATQKSGSMITARLAVDYNKTVMAVPGSIFWENSTGPNYLIQQGAETILSGQEILDFFKLEKNNNDNQNNLSEKEKIIWNLIANPKSFDELLEQTEMKIFELNEIISWLEIRGLIKVINGKICQK